MIYLMSDIHGEKKAFDRMLKKIKFNPFEDQLIIIGDVLDRGEDGLALLFDLMPWIEEGSVILLKGNHELFCELWMQEQISDARWSVFGGEDTLQQITKLSEEEREKLLSFFQSLPHYLCLDTEAFGKTVITHTGIHCDYYCYREDGRIDVEKSIKLAIRQNEYQYLLSTDVHFAAIGDKRKWDRYIICGHVPTFHLHEGTSNKIYKDHYMMDIDCGSGYRDQGGVLGCYCLENGKEYYV